MADTTKAPTVAETAPPQQKQDPVTAPAVADTAATTATKPPKNKKKKATKAQTAPQTEQKAPATEPAVAAPPTKSTSATTQAPLAPQATTSVPEAPVVPTQTTPAQSAASAPAPAPAKDAAASKQSKPTQETPQASKPSAPKKSEKTPQPAESTPETTQQAPQKPTKQKPAKQTEKTPAKPAVAQEAPSQSKPAPTKSAWGAPQQRQTAASPAVAPTNATKKKKGKGEQTPQQAPPASQKSRKGPPEMPLSQRIKLPTKTVVVQGSVIMKIAAHTRTTPLEVPTGSLLGLPSSQGLEVTSCFPMPHAEVVLGAEEEQMAADRDDQYQTDYVNKLHEINFDSFVVGWYQHTSLEQYVSEQFIESQYVYQRNLPCSVVLVYDPLKTVNERSLSLRAFKLSSSFMTLCNNQPTVPKELFLTLSTNGLVDVLEELPIRVANTALVNAWLFDLEKVPALTPERTALDMNITGSLDKNLTALVECVDDLTEKQARYQAYQRSLNRQAAYLKRMEEEGESAAQAPRVMQQPDHMESVIVSAKIARYCTQISKFTSRTLPKVYMVGSGSL
ncbi:eukaryotic translation initiation factor 3 subunit H [Pelomyxa schiedti]|nr:eukaryotic translation initiation factor 3 subunit H [Pelomyxa schiedti]